MSSNPAISSNESGGGGAGISRSMRVRRQVCINVLILQKYYL